MCRVSLFQLASPERVERESLSVSQMFERVGSLHDVGDCSRLPLFVCMRHEAVGITHLCSGYVCVCAHVHRFTLAAEAELASTLRPVGSQGCSRSLL